MNQDGRSVWWVELLIGVVCAGTAVVFGLSHTSIGPFASYTVTYSTAIAALYLVVAGTVGGVFLASSIRRSPYGLAHDATEGTLEESETSVGQDSDI